MSEPALDLLPVLRVVAYRDAPCSTLMPWTPARFVSSPMPY